MSLQTAGDATFRVPSEEPVAPECASVSCEVSSVITDPAVVGAIALLGLVAFVAFAYVRDARECCQNERRRVVDERDAFEEFADRIESFDATPMDTTTAALDGPVIGAQRGSGFVTPGDVRLRQVVDAYTETVVSLPHYHQEYDETVAESLAAEIGPDAASTVLSGGTLSPELQSTIVARSRQAVTSRESLVDAIDAEMEALDDAEARLTEIDRQRQNLHDHLDGVSSASTVDASIDVWRRLEELETGCNELAASRQQQVRDPPMTVASEPDDAPSFYNYLYDSIEDVSHPVLAEVSNLAERIRSDRDRLVKRIAHAGH